MQKTKQISRVLSTSAAALMLSSIGVEARAGALEGNGDCNVNDVQVTSIENQKEPGTDLLPITLPDGTELQSISASNCLGAFPQNGSGNGDGNGNGNSNGNSNGNGNGNSNSNGNSNGDGDGDGSPDYTSSLDNLGDNLGYENEGFFLNNKEFFPEHGAFVDEDDLQDLKDKGEFVDPGWIFVSKLEIEEGEGVLEKTGTVKNDADGDGTKEEYTFADDIFTMDCGTTDGKTDCTTGTWTLTPPETNPDALLSILGANKFFDQAALLLKGAKEYAIYNFTLSGAGLLPVLEDDYNYKFEGTWSTDGLSTPNGNSTPDLSHAILAFRDPSGDPPGVEPIPEPTTLALMGLGLLGLGGMSLRRRKG